MLDRRSLLSSWLVLAGFAFASPVIPAAAQAPISEVQKLVASGGDDGDRAGSSVAISGNTAVSQTARAARRGRCSGWALRSTRTTWRSKTLQHSR